MTKEFANRVYDILVLHLRAYEGLRTNFVYECTDSLTPVREFRFQGDLGFGGKYRTNTNKVDCYPEDETPGRLALIDIANKELVRLNDVA